MERQRRAFKERWGDEEGAESSQQVRIEASKESWKDKEGQTGAFKERRGGGREERWGDEEGAENSLHGRL